MTRDLGRTRRIGLETTSTCRVLSAWYDCQEWSLTSNLPDIGYPSSGSDISPPERFDLVWWQERGQRRFWCWRPIPPPGYVSLETWVH